MQYKYIYIISKLQYLHEYKKWESLDKNFDFRQLGLPYKVEMDNVNGRVDVKTLYVDEQYTIPAVRIENEYIFNEEGKYLKNIKSIYWYYKVVGTNTIDYVSLENMDNVKVYNDRVLRYLSDGTPDWSVSVATMKIWREKIESYLIAQAELTPEFKSIYVDIFKGFREGFDDWRSFGKVDLLYSEMDIAFNNAQVFIGSKIADGTFTSAEDLLNTFIMAIVFGQGSLSDEMLSHKLGLYLNLPPTTPEFTNIKDYLKHYINEEE